MIDVRSIVTVPAYVLVCSLAASSPTLPQTISPVSGNPLVQQAALYYAEGAYGKVISVFDGVPFDSLSGRAAFYIGSSFAALGDFQNSIRHLRQAVALEPGHIGQRFQLARMLALGGLVRDSKTAYTTLLSLDSTFFPALTGYGILLYEEGEYARAADTFNRALVQNPRDYSANYYLGACLDRLGLPDSAATYLAASITLNPHYPPALTFLASLYYNKREYNQALLLYERLCAEYPRSPDYWYKAGLCSEKLSGEQLAIDLFRRALALDSTEALYYAHLGQLYFGLSRFDSSAAAYRQAVRFDVDNPVLHMNLALCLARMDSTEPALTSFKRAIAAHHVEKTSLVYNQWGALVYNKKRYREARTAYRKALLYDPNNSESLFFLGFTNYQLMKYTEAQTAFKRFLQTAAGDPTQRKRIEAVERQLKALSAAK